MFLKLSYQHICPYDNDFDTNNCTNYDVSLAVMQNKCDDKQSCLVSE